MADTMDPWEKKAHDVIAALSLEAFENANRMKNGRLRKKHVPYTVPEVVNVLVKCLGDRDEHRAKCVFMELSHGCSVANLDLASSM